MMIAPKAVSGHLLEDSGQTWESTGKSKLNTMIRRPIGRRSYMPAP